MPSFSYVARETATGREIRNTIEAGTEQAAIATLLNRNLLVVEIREKTIKRGQTKGGKVAGCHVSSGKLVRGKMRIRRGGHVIYEGVSLTLRRFQDEVNEVRAGMECGVRLDGFDEAQEGDLIECYVIEKVAQKLS